MEYRSTRCPYCGKRLEFLKPYYGGDYGSPLRRCIHCGEIYIDSSIKEPALFSPLKFYFKEILSLVAAVAAFGIVSTVLIYSALDYFIDAEYLPAIVISVCSTIWLLILIWGILKIKNGIYDKSIQDSIDRLMDPEYREVLENSGIAISKKSIFYKHLKNMPNYTPKKQEIKNKESNTPSTFVNEIQGLKENVTETPKDKKSYKTVSIVLAVALVTSVISIFGIVEILNYTKDNLDYLSSNAVFVTETGNKYHRYNCDILGARSYWIYNIELAESMGYEPCSECWPSYDSSNEESSHSYLGEIVNDEDIEKAKEIENERYNYVAKEIRDFKKTIGEEEIEKFKHKEEDQSDSAQTSFSGSAVRSLKRAIDKSN